MSPDEVDARYEQEIGPVWRELRGGLWHSTASHRFRSILDSGAIEPAPTLPAGEHMWFSEGTTCCRSLNAVSLFDFAEADWDFILGGRCLHRWQGFLRAPAVVLPTDKWIATVWISVDRGHLVDFMPIEEVGAKWRSGDLERNWMSRIEACHRGPIPLSACSKVVVVCAVEPQEFRAMDLHPFDVSQLDGLESEWRTRYAHHYELRSLSEAERLARVVAHLGDPKT